MAVLVRFHTGTTEKQADGLLADNIPLEKIHGLRDPKPSVERRIYRRERRRIIERAVRTLDLRRQLVIRKRFGLYDGDEWTLSAIAPVLGVCRERVRQMESEGLGMLRRELEPVRREVCG